MAEKYEMLWLPSKHNYYITCPGCDEYSECTRPGIEPDHSYLEYVKGTKTECPICNMKLKIDMNWMYGYVVN